MQRSTGYLGSYLKTVNRLLLCSRKEKNQKFTKLRAEMQIFSDEFLEVNGRVCGKEDILLHFGTPEEMACALQELDDPSSLLIAEGRRKHFRLIVILIIVTIGIIIAGFQFVNYLDSVAYQNGYYIETIIPDITPGPLPTPLETLTDGKKEN